MKIARYLHIKTCLFILLLTVGCATTPKDNIQRLYVAEWTITGAANAVADLKPVIKPDDYAKAKGLILVSSDALSCGKAAEGLKVATLPAVCPVLPSGQQGALGYLQLIQSNLMALSAYYASKGQ